MRKASVKESIAVKLAVTGAFVILIILASGTPFAGAQLERDEFKFKYENSENLVVLPVQQPAPTPPVQPDEDEPSALPDPPIPPVPHALPDFTVSVSPDSQRVLNQIAVQKLESGQLTTRYVDSYGTGMAAVSVQRSTSFTIYVRSLNRFSDSVRLSVSGMPRDTTCSFPQNVSVPAGGTAVAPLNITTTSSTPAGTYTLTVTATCGGVSRSDSVELVVEEKLELESSGGVSGPAGVGGPVYDGGSVGGPIARSYTVNTLHPTIDVNGIKVVNYLDEQKRNDQINTAQNISSGITVNKIVINNAINVTSTTSKSASGSSSASQKAVSLALNVARAVLNLIKK